MLAKFLSLLILINMNLDQQTEMRFVIRTISENA
jgi:hypothetical protein